MTRYVQWSARLSTWSCLTCACRAWTACPSERRPQRDPRRHDAKEGGAAPGKSGEPRWLKAKEKAMSALRKKVLVVDDDPVVARSVERVLSDRGYAVITASDGPEALKKLADAAYDVLFTAIRLR